MKKLDNEQLANINGGAISGTILQYVSKITTTIFEIGRALGSSIRRVESDSICPV